MMTSSALDLSWISWNISTCNEVRFLFFFQSEVSGEQTSENALSSARLWLRAVTSGSCRPNICSMKPYFNSPSDKSSESSWTHLRSSFKPLKSTSSYIIIINLTQMLRILAWFQRKWINVIWWLVLSLFHDSLQGIEQFLHLHEFIFSLNIGILHGKK